jgi:hypothetical protein
VVGPAPLVVQPRPRRRIGFGEELDGTAEIANRAGVVLAGYPGQPSDLEDADCRLATRQVRLARAEDFIVPLQLQQRRDSQGVRVRVVGDDLQGGVAGCEHVVVSSIGEQEPAPRDLVVGRRGARLWLAANRFVEVADRRVTLAWREILAIGLEQGAAAIQAG